VNSVVELPGKRNELSGLVVLGHPANASQRWGWSTGW